MANAIIATAQPAFATTGLISLTSAAGYAAAAPTATAPSTTGSVALLYGKTQNYPSLLRLTPMASNNNFTAVGMRVVGWNEYIQTSGTKIYVPTVLADLTLGYSTGTVPSLSVNSVTEYYFSSVTVGIGVPSVNLYSPATAAATNTELASVVVDAIGSQYLTVQFKATGTTPKLGTYWTTI